MHAHGQCTRCTKPTKTTTTTAATTRATTTQQQRQGNYSLRRPPKLIIQKIFNKQKWATVYRFMCNRICKSKCLVFQRHFDILFHNLSKINLDVFIRLFHLHWTFKCNWKSLNVDKKQTMTLWPRHNGLWSGRSEEVRPKGPADAPSNTRWLHGRAP